MAQERQAVILSQEKPKPGSRVPFKIPDVARAVGVRTIRLDEFVNVVQGLAEAESAPTGDGTSSEPSPTSGDDDTG